MAKRRDQPNPSAHREGLVVELAPVDGLAAGAGSVREVTALEHKLRHQPNRPYNQPRRTHTTSQRGQAGWTVRLRFLKQCHSASGGRLPATAFLRLVHVHRTHTNDPHRQGLA